MTALGADLLAHEGHVRPREHQDGHRDERDDVRPDEQQALVDRQQRWDPPLVGGLDQLVDRAGVVVGGPALCRDRVDRRQQRRGRLDVERRR